MTAWFPVLCLCVSLMLWSVLLCLCSLLAIHRSVLILSSSIPASLLDLQGLVLLLDLASFVGLFPLFVGSIGPLLLCLGIHVQLWLFLFGLVALLLFFILFCSLVSVSMGFLVGMIRWFIVVIPVSSLVVT